MGTFVSVPTWVPLPGAPHTRLGRWHLLGQDRALAFAMAEHFRLGAGSVLHAAPPEMTRLMYGDMARFEPSAFAGPGLRALMGFE